VAGKEIDMKECQTTMKYYYSEMAVRKRPCCYRLAHRERIFKRVCVIIRHYKTAENE
jgi:hypothetical protein